MANEPRIRRLDRQTAEKIAAGEVIERPAAVVKELVENSLDAGASRIEIQLEDGGRQLIRVSDDGRGMAAGDVPLAFQRHATSKIRSAADLEQITTLGFRGEALPSIAAVSVVELITRPEAALVGTRVRLEGGQLVERGETGAAPGTEVVVRRLFYNTPARREHLRSSRHELAVVGRLVTGLALGHPQVAFSLIHGERQILRTSGSGERRRAVGEAWGWDLVDRLLPVENQAKGRPRLAGFVGRPQLSRADRQHQVLLINGRPVRSQSLQQRLERPYKGRLMRGRFPIAVIWLELAPQAYDINVHPAKMEVRFREPDGILPQLEDAVRQALAGVQLVPEAGGGGRQKPGAGTAPTADRVRERRPAYGLEPASGVRGSCVVTRRRPMAGDHSILDAQAGGYPQLEPLAQIDRTYIVARAQGSLYLVDQHAAHERLFYEALTPLDDEVPRQQLVAPVTLGLSPSEWALYEEAAGLLTRLGFEVRPFGGRSLLVTAVPVLFGGAAAPDLLRTWLGALQQGEGTAAGLAEEEAAVTMAACKAAVKAHDALSLEEMASLLAQLRAAQAPYSCPHGRPTTVALTVSALARLFGRS